MRKQSWDQWRDLVVRWLARLSLIAVLAVLGALFVGGAAASQASDSAASSSTHAATQPGMRDQARPAGLVLGAVAIAGGMAVLMVGALRPRTARESVSYAELVDH